MCFKLDTNNSTNCKFHKKILSTNYLLISPVSMSKLFLTVLVKSTLILLSPNSLFQFTVGMETFETAESASSSCLRDLKL